MRHIRGAHDSPLVARFASVSPTRHGKQRTEASFGASTAHCNAAFLKQAGVPVDFIRLADIGIRDNGHFLMLEKNNLEIAGVIADWLDRRVTPSETAAGEKTGR